MKLRYLVLLTTCALCVGPAAMAQVPQIPQAWAGIWETETTERDCTTGNITDQYTETDTLCTGSSFDPDDGFDEICTGTWDDTNADLSCNAMMEPIPGCTATFTYTLSAVRNGESFNGSGQRTVTLTGATCPPGGDVCVDFDLSGMRTGPEPPECTNPVQPMSWGRIKATYD